MFSMWDTKQEIVKELGDPLGYFCDRGTIRGGWESPGFYHNEVETSLINDIDTILDFGKIEFEISFKEGKNIEDQKRSNNSP